VSAPPKLQWDGLYTETELYKTALRVYTKPLFSWRKALTTSTDEGTLYDFARNGLSNLERLNKALIQRKFHFRPGIALHRRFGKKERTLYLFPWEDRIVDLLLYRLVNHALHGWFSPNAYAYREGGYNLDLCQTKVGRALAAKPVSFVLKRDITNYFDSIDHALLLKKVSTLVDADDYLFHLLAERAACRFVESGSEPDAVPATAQRGVPFGTATACLLANIFLADLDDALAAIPGVSYFRYADDILIVAPDAETARAAAAAAGTTLERLKLFSKESHHKDLVFSPAPLEVSGFEPASRLRHLGLEFRAGAPTALSRDKLRKICNLFKFALRRQAANLRKSKDPKKRALLAVTIIKQTLERGVRNVALIDYYLRHVDDERQLRLLDRWLAEEVLAVAFQKGHKKGLFRSISFETLRAMGLPSLVHRARLLRHGHLKSPFFIWKSYKCRRASNRTAVRPRSLNAAVFSPGPAAATVS
jgi:hypothetical protein